MATGWYNKTGGAKTTWSTSGNWRTTATGTTSSGAGPNGSGQAAYIGTSNMVGVNSYLALGAATTLSSLLIGSNYNVGTTTIVGSQLTFTGTFSDSSLNGIILYPGAGSLTIGQGWISGEGTRLYFNQSLPSITNNSSNSISLNDADDPIYNTTPSVGSLTFKTNGAGNIFIGKSISNSNGLATGNLFQVIVDSTGAGWTYFGNQSPYYEVTTYGKVLLYIYAGNFAFNHSRVRRGDTNTFSEGITLGTTFRGANQQINLDAWIEYLTTSRINFGPNGTGSDPVNLNYFGSANATFGSNSASNVMSGPSSGTITHTLNIQGSTFTINGNIVSNTAVAHSNVIKNGNGTLVLNGTSSAFVSYTQNAGTTRVGTAGSLGAGTVTLNGGTLSTTTGGTSFATSNNNFVINGSVTVGEAGYGGWLSVYGTTNIAGNSTISAVSELFLENQLQGSATLTKTGNSNLWLKNNYGNAAPSFTGQFILNNGALFLGGFNSSTPNQLNNASSITLNGGHVQVCGNVANTFTNSISGGVDIYFRNTSAGGITFTNSANYFGSPRLYADSAEGATTAQKWTTKHLGFSTFYYLLGADFTQNITQTIVYSGTTAAIQNSALQVNAYQANRSITAVFENASTNNTTVTFNEAVNNHTTNAQPAQTFRFNATSGRIIQNGPIRDLYTGTLNVIKSGSYDVTLNSAGTYRGSTTVSQGKLIAANKTALGTGAVIVSGSLQCTDTTTDEAKLASVSSFTSNGGRLILGS